MAAHLKEEPEITWDILKPVMTQRSEMKACWLYSFSYDFRWKAVMCSIRSSVSCQTLLMEIAQRHGPLKVLDGIRALGGIWGINHILIKVWMTPKKTILEGFSYLFSLKKKNETSSQIRSEGLWQLVVTISQPSAQKIFLNGKDWYFKQSFQMNFMDQIWQDYSN